MTVQLKYYSYTDADSGKTSKDVGWIGTISNFDVVVQVQQGIPVILKNEPVESAVSRVPSGQDVKEISVDEYNKLDVSGESDRAKARRQHAERAALKVVAAGNATPVSPADDLVKQLSAMPQVQAEAQKAKEVVPGVSPAVAAQEQKAKVKAFNANR